MERPSNPNLFEVDKAQKRAFAVFACFVFIALVYAWTNSSQAVEVDGNEPVLGLQDLGNRK